MKTMKMDRDFSYRVGQKNAFIQYLGGHEYARVPEAQARVITAAGAGRPVSQEAASE